MFASAARISQNNDWISAIFLLTFILLTLAKVLFGNRIFHASMLFLQKKYLLIYYGKDKSVVWNLFQMLLFIVKFLILSLLLFYINSFFKLNAQLFELKGYLFLLVGVALYFVARLGIELFLSRILNFEKSYKKVLYDKVSYFNNLVLWLLPFLLIYTYAPSHEELFFNILLFVSIALFVIRYALLMNGNKNLIFSNLFYFILYLCALEISPVVIVLKLII